MAVVVTPLTQSDALGLYPYDITGLVQGANAITLPAPPALGSWDPSGDWTPTVIKCFPYASGAAGALVTPDLTTIANSLGTVSFTLYAADATNCLVECS